MPMKIRRGVGLAMERTLILLKPDCVQRRLMGRILSRFEDKGFNVIAMKLMQVTPELSKQHYAEHVAKPFYPTLEAFITGGPVVAMILEGLEVIRVVRQMNLVHASDGPEAAQREIKLYFKETEIVACTPTIAPWLKSPDES
jgi:nucleoside-diphosphate kinase